MAVTTVTKREDRHVATVVDGMTITTTKKKRGRRGPRHPKKSKESTDETSFASSSSDSSSSPSSFVPSDDSSVDNNTNNSKLSSSSSSAAAAAASKKKKFAKQSRSGVNNNDNADKTSTNRCRCRVRGKKEKASPSQQQQLLELSDEEKAVYVALDCEMVGVGMDGLTSQLARVTVVDWDGQVLLDAYIRPEQPVTDYRTFVSGITEEHLVSDDAMDWNSCRTAVASLLQDKILVGHALKNDLQALQIRHPWYLTRDTARYEPFMKLRDELQDGILWPRKLKELATEKLHREIQQPGVPHSPYEDAMAALDLYKSVRSKWEKVMEYKVSKTQQILLQQQQQQTLLEQADVPACSASPMAVTVSAC